MPLRCVQLGRAPADRPWTDACTSAEELRRARGAFAADDETSLQSEVGPTEDEVREALSFAAVRARECGASRYGTAGTDIVFERDGHVRSVEVHAVGLPPELRACVADAVRDARVPPFERETLHVRYPIRL